MKFGELIRPYPSEILSYMRSNPTYLTLWAWHEGVGTVEFLKPPELQARLIEIYQIKPPNEIAPRMRKLRIIKLTKKMKQLLTFEEMTAPKLLKLKHINGYQYLNQCATLKRQLNRVLARRRRIKEWVN